MEEPGRFSPFAGMTRIRFKGFGLSPSQPRFGTPLEQHQCGPADSGCQQGPCCNAAPCRRGLPVAAKLQPNPAEAGQSRPSSFTCAAHVHMFRTCLV
jgi:hypothetical protein